FDREMQWANLGADVKRTIEAWPEWVVARNTGRMEKIAYAHNLRIARAAADGSQSRNAGGDNGGRAGPTAGCFIAVKDNKVTCEVEKTGETDVEMEEDEVIEETAETVTEEESETLGSLGVHIVDSA